MRFIRFLVGVIGVIFFFAVPILAFTGGTAVIISFFLKLFLDIPLGLITSSIIIFTILFFILSLYMVWWGFIDKEHSEYDDIENNSYSVNKIHETKKTNNKEKIEVYDDEEDYSDDDGFFERIKANWDWSYVKYIILIVLLIACIVALILLKLKPE